MWFRIRQEYGKYKGWNSWVWSHFGQFSETREGPWVDCIGQQWYQSWDGAAYALESHFGFDEVWSHFCHIG